MALESKQIVLLGSLRDLGSVIVAYSGGADSAYLAWAAHQALGDRAIAITADSASFPESHKRDAGEFAREQGFRHEYIVTHEFENPDYVKNVRTAASTARTNYSPGSMRSLAREESRT